MKHFSRILVFSLLLLLCSICANAQSGTALRLFSGTDAQRIATTCRSGDVFWATNTAHFWIGSGSPCSWVDFGAGGGGGGTVGSGATGQIPYYAANGTTLTATSSIFLGSNSVVIKPAVDSTTGIQVQTSTASKLINFDTSNNKIGLFWDTIPSTAIGQVHIVGTNGVEREHGIIYDQYSDAQPTAKFWFRSNRGTPASPSPMLAGDGLINFAVDGQDGSGSFGGYAGYAGRMRWTATENFSANHWGTKWVIYVSANGSSAGAVPSLVVDQDKTLYVGGDVTSTTPLSAVLSPSGASGSNIAGADTIVQAGAGTGTGVGGTYRVKVAAAGSTGSALNTYADALTIDSTKLATFPGAVTITGAATVKSLQPASDSTTAIQAFKADGTTVILDVDSTNKRLGIGTAVPDATLAVNRNATTTFATGAGASAGIHVQGLDANFSRIQSDSFGQATNYEGRRHDGTAASPTAVLANEVLVSLGGQGNRAAGSSMTGNVGELRVVASENFGVGTTGTYLSFLTTVNGTATTTEKMRLDNAGNISTLAGKITNYSAVNTAGWGVPAIYGSGRATAQVAANASVATYTVGAADGSFEVSANVLVTTATTHAFTVTCTYTDEGNTSRTLTLTFSALAGTLLTSIANTGGAVPYEGVPLHIRAKASTSITIATTGTFTAVVYNVEGIIKQMS